MIYFEKRVTNLSDLSAATEALLEFWYIFREP